MEQKYCPKQGKYQQLVRTGLLLSALPIYCCHGTDPDRPPPLPFPSSLLSASLLQQSIAGVAGGLVLKLLAPDNHCRPWE